MIRLMQAIAGAEHGGAEAFFLRLALALQARTDRLGITQHIVTRPYPARTTALRDAGIPLTELRFGGRFDFSTRRGFKAAIARYRPQVVLTWMSRASRMCPRTSPSAPFVHVARLGGYYDQKYFQDCDALIANTRDIADWLMRQGISPNRVHYLPNFVAAEPGVAIDRAALDTPADVPLVLAMGRLHTNKAFDVLIRALAAVPRAHCWILGEGPEREALEAQARDCGVADRVRLPGWNDDVGPYYRAADIYACPSRHEPLGNVVLEAWAYAKPVLAAASVGPSGLIDHEQTGLLVPVDDVAAFAAGLTSLIETPELARGIAENGHSAYEAAFTPDTVVGQYADMLHGLLAARGIGFEGAA